LNETVIRREILENKHKNVDREAATNIMYQIFWSKWISNKFEQNQVNESIHTLEFGTFMNYFIIHIGKNRLIYII
jgi:hypothetical protein